METLILFNLENISVSYKDAPALKNISLRIREGEKLALIGPSGAGKTTLLKKLYEIRPGHAAFIHQDYALVPQLSVFHNVFTGRLDRHRTFYNILNLIRPQKREVDQIHSVLGSLGMGEKIFERVAKLSGGQQQRVAVARAMFKRCNVLLADEPVSSIDPHQAGHVLTLLKQMAPTVIVTLHAVQFALEHFERIVGICHGRIRFDLPVKKVTNCLVSELYENC